MLGKHDLRMFDNLPGPNEKICSAICSLWKSSVQDAEENTEWKDATLPSTDLNLRPKPQLFPGGDTVDDVPVLKAGQLVATGPAVFHFVGSPFGQRGLGMPVSNVL